MRRPKFVARRRKARGFTLVELMVSLVMFSFAIAGVLAVAVSMANGFREQRAGVGTEGTARAAMDFLSDAIRGASPGITTGVIWPMDDATCTTTGVNLAFRTIMGNETDSDSLTLTFAYGSVVTTALSAYDPSGAGAITVEDVSQFQDGDFVVVTNFKDAVLLKVNVVGNTLAYAAAASGCSPPAFSEAIGQGSVVVRALRARFYVEPLDGVPTLWMDPDPNPAVTNDAEPLAEGIEDLQIVLGIDNASDGLGAENSTTDGDEWWGNLPAENIPTTAPIALRAVRLSLVSRALTRVSGTAAFVRPALEDRDGGTADNFRRRVLTSMIEVRNMAGSQ
jgi:prepilin-type N-terminal cleavage/methylation domain-containing protein